VRRVQVLPPSAEVATRSLRDARGPTSCFQVATRLRGLVGLTVTIGSSSYPVMAVSSKRAPGQPAANGLGPEITRSCFTLYGPTVCGRPPATAGSGAPTSSRLATSDDPASKVLDLIAHPPAHQPQQQAAP
jgi:hypothetical protein